MKAEAKSKDINPKSKKKKVIIILAIVVIIAFFGIAIFSTKFDSGKEVQKIVKIQDVEMKSIEANIFTNGVVASGDKRIINSEISAEIKSINVVVGDFVQKDAVIAVFDTKEIERNLETSRISLKIAKIRLSELQGSGKKTYDITLDNASINLENTKKNLEDAKVLYESGSISKLEYDNSKRAYDLANNDYILAKRNYENYGKESQIEINKLEISSSELNIKKLEDELANASVKAPISGTITSIDVKSGEVVSFRTPMFVIEDTQNLKIETNISEYDIKAISIGQDVKVTNEGSLEEYSGKVSYIAPAAKKISNGQNSETIIAVEVEIIDKETDFKPNYTANIEINTAKDSNALVVPYEALYTNKDGEKIIYIVNEENRAKLLIAETGIEGDLVIQILNSDLKEGDKVIVNPSEELNDGDLLKISEVK